MVEALQITPHGMPVVAYPISLALILLAAWDAVRAPRKGWFRWLEPTGVAVFFSGIFMLKVWVLLIGVLVTGLGLGLGRRRERSSQADGAHFRPAGEPVSRDQPTFLASFWNRRGGGTHGGSSEFKVPDKSSPLGVVLSLCACFVVIAALVYALLIIVNGNKTIGQTIFVVVIYLVVTLAVVVVVGLLMLPTLRVLRSIPFLSMDREGVTLHAAGLRLPWSNIAEVWVTEVPGDGEHFREMLLFKAVDDQLVLDSTKMLARKVAEDGLRRFGGPIWVFSDSIALPIDEVASAVELFGSVPVRRIAGRCFKAVKVRVMQPWLLFIVTGQLHEVVWADFRLWRAARGRRLVSRVLRVNS